MNVIFNEQELCIIRDSLVFMGRLFPVEKREYLNLWKKITPKTNSDFVEAIIMGGKMTHIKTFSDGCGIWNVEKVETDE